MISQYLVNNNDLMFEDCQNIIKFLDDYKTSESKEQLKELLHFLLKLSKNGKQNTTFYTQIVSHFAEKITKSFFNEEIVICL